MDVKDQDLLSNLIKYNWNYFEYHAHQRITLFNFYIGFLTVFLYAFGYLIARHLKLDLIGSTIPLLALSIFLIIITRVFDLLDERNEQLIGYAKKSLLFLEKKMIDDPLFIGIEKAMVFMKENNENEKDKKIGHRTCFKIIFYFSYIVGLLLFLYSFCKVTNFLCLC